MKKCVILGAGISGLCAAWFLKKAHGNKIDITLYEKSSRVGGWIHSIEKDGFLFEAGPRGFRPAGKGKLTLELVRELGLEKHLISASVQSKKRYICLNNQLRRVSIPFMLQQGLLGALVRDLFTPRSTQEDETVASFTRRRFNQKLTQNLVDPFCKGVFGADAEKLSMRFCLPTLWNLEKEHRSIIKGLLKTKKRSQKKPPASLYSFKQGMEMLPKTLAQKLDAKIILNHEVRSLHEIEADLIISALPTHVLAKLLDTNCPQEFSTLSTISLGWNASLLSKRGYGFLVPSKEQGDILGMTWDSEMFPDQNKNKQTRVCVMIEGADREESLYSRALKSVETHLGIKKAPDAFYVGIAHQAIPQYTLNHEKRLNVFKQLIPPHMHLVGSCYKGVGINDCISATADFKAALL